MLRSSWILTKSGTNRRKKKRFQKQSWRRKTAQKRRIGGEEGDKGEKISLNSCIKWKYIRYTYLYYSAEYTRSHYLLIVIAMES